MWIAALLSSFNNEERGQKTRDFYTTVIYTTGEINYASSTTWKLKDTEVEQPNLKKIKHETTIKF